MTKMTQECDLTLIGWGSIGPLEDDQLVSTPEGLGIDITGYNASDYWESDGTFKGPDNLGITPVYIDANGQQFPTGAYLYPHLS